MGNLERFKIDLKSLTDRETAFQFSLDNAYFETLGSTDVKGGDINADLAVRKTAGVYELHFHIQGSAVVACDVCLDDMMQPIDTQGTIVARLGDTYDDSGEQIVVPAEEGILDVSWLLYEQVILAIPTRHVHAEGLCNPEMLERIGQMSVSADDEPSSDPRWSELEKLRSIIKE